MNQDKLKQFAEQYKQIRQEAATKFKERTKDDQCYLCQAPHDPATMHTAQTIVNGEVCTIWICNKHKND